MYDLVAVVIHCGSGPNRGHYISIVKSHGFWLIFDDDIVDKIDPAAIEDFYGLTADVQKSSETGYILFYESRDPQWFMLCDDMQTIIFVFKFNKTIPPLKPKSTTDQSLLLVQDKLSTLCLTTFKIASILQIKSYVTRVLSQNTNNPSERSSDWQVGWHCSSCWWSGPRLINSTLCIEIEPAVGSTREILISLSCLVFV